MSRCVERPVRGESSPPRELCCSASFANRVRQHAGQVRTLDLGAYIVDSRDGEVPANFVLTTGVAAEGQSVVLPAKAAVQNVAR